MLKVFLRNVIILLVCVRFIRGLSVGDIARNAKLKEMRSYMNESLDPCENFYEFSCANYANLNPIVPPYLRMGVMELLQIEQDRKAKALLAIDGVTDIGAYKKVKDFYGSCVFLREMGPIYFDKLKGIIKEFGQMPVLEGDNWQERDFDWVKTVAEISYKYDFPIILYPVLMPDFFDNSAQAIVAYLGHFQLDARSLYVNPEFEQNRIEYKNEVSLYLAAYLNIDPELSKKTAEEIVDFEIDLAHGIHDEKLGLELREMFNLTTIDEMQRTYSPSLDIKKMIKTTWGSMPPYRFYNNPLYLQNLVNVMEKTPKRVVANYVFYKLIRNFFFSILETQEEQQDYCYTSAKTYFASIFEAMIYHKYKAPQTEEDIQEMWNIFKLAFQDVLESPRLRWIHEGTRKYAMEKLTAMNIEIEPLTYETAIKYDADFNNMRFVKRDYVENVKLLFMQVAKDTRDDLYKAPEAPAAPHAGPTPMYIPAENLVKIPGSALQPNSIWSPEFSNAFNFAKIGSLLAHEITHGFDDNGRLYDIKGNLRDWWDTDSANAFLERKQCFVDQYSKYIYAGQPLPKTNAQAENIADNGGIRLAYHAYLKWSQDSSRSRQELARETFPGLHYTNKQLFFIAFAQVWCHNTDPENKLEVVAIDEHSPGEFRVIGTLSNLKEFSEAFTCPLGSGMNPANKCEIY